MEHNKTYTDYKVHIYADGEKYWYLNDLLHREDGPAVECANGDKYWYLNGERYTEEKHAQATQRVEELTLEQVCLELGREIKIIK